MKGRSLLTNSVNLAFWVNHRLPHTTLHFQRLNTNVFLSLQFLLFLTKLLIHCFISVPLPLFSSSSISNSLCLSSQKNSLSQSLCFICTILLSFPSLVVTRGHGFTKYRYILWLANCLRPKKTPSFTCKTWLVSVPCQSLWDLFNSEKNTDCEVDCVFQSLHPFSPDGFFDFFLFGLDLSLPKMIRL